jgi:SH3-like domain-containing protein
MTSGHKILGPAAGLWLAFLLAFSAAAAERGPVTNLPMPRFVSLKAEESNVRRGPSLSHRIDWVFTRRNMPLEVTAEYGHWRRVRDRDGMGGWVHYSLLSGVRHVIIERDATPLFIKPDPESPVNAMAQSGVIARLDSCGLDWCQIVAGGNRGWVEKRRIWGISPEEMRD